MFLWIFLGDVWGGEGCCCCGLIIIITGWPASRGYLLATCMFIWHVKLDCEPVTVDAALIITGR